MDQAGQGGAKAMDSLRLSYHVYIYMICMCMYFISVCNMCIMYGRMPLSFFLSPPHPHACLCMHTHTERHHHQLDRPGGLLRLVSRRPPPSSRAAGQVRCMMTADAIAPPPKHTDKHAHTQSLSLTHTHSRPIPKIKQKAWAPSCTRRNPTAGA